MMLNAADAKSGKVLRNRLLSRKTMILVVLTTILKKGFYNAGTFQCLNAGAYAILQTAVLKVLKKVFVKLNYTPKKKRKKKEQKKKEQKKKKVVVTARS